MTQKISNPDSEECDKPPLLQRLKQLFRLAPQTTEDMVAMVDAASQNEVIDNDARRMIAGALEVSAMHARDVMIPRTQMTVLRIDDSMADNLQKIIESAHSRYPVIGETMDEVLGTLLAKDLLPLIFNQELLDTSGGKSEHIIRELLRPAVFIPESKRLNLLLRQFRENRNHMALVIDEYGTLAGLVTIEDVLEEIVGEIEDEHDMEEEENIRKLSNSNYMIQALTPIEEFNSYFKTQLLSENFDTLGGIVTNKFGHLPQRGEQISFSGLTFHVMRADNRRLHSLRMSVESDASTATQDKTNGK